MDYLNFIVKVCCYDGLEAFLLGVGVPYGQEGINSECFKALKSAKNIHNDIYSDLKILKQRSPHKRVTVNS